MPGMRREIGELWHQINRHAHECFRQAFRGCDLPGVTLLFLRQLADEPGLTLSDLARRTGMVKSHVSRTIDQLDREGYVEKRSDPTDQRVLRLHPTHRALELQHHLEDRVRGAWTGVMLELPPEEQQVVVQGLRTLLAAFERAAGEVVEGGGCLEPDSLDQT